MPNHTDNSYDTRLKEIRDTYFKIGHLKCPCLNNEHVYFNQSGFRHFLRKGRLIRPIPDQLRRFALFRFVTKVITSNETKITETRENGTISSYELTLEVSRDYNVKIVVIRNAKGINQYVSVMD